jgi:hypothetical protein
MPSVLCNTSTFKDLDPAILSNGEIGEFLDASPVI